MDQSVYITSVTGLSNNVSYTAALLLELFKELTLSGKHEEADRVFLARYRLLKACPAMSELLGFVEYIIELQ